ncbi:MAG: sigma-70 family RNA polymerase sigma factor [Saccharofermentanales bacterium]
MLKEEEMVSKEVYDELEDNALVRLARDGDGFAMETVLIRYKKMVKRKASKLFIAGGDYDDVIQEGMIGLFKAVRNYKDDKGVPFSSFAVYCVLAQITDAVRKASRNKHNALNLSISLQGLAMQEEDDPYSLLDVYIDISKADPEQLAISKEEYESLSVFTQKELTQNERDALLLFIAGYTYAEIASKLDRSVKSIDNAIQRAREKFEIFKKQYFY